MNCLAGGTCLLWGSIYRCVYAFKPLTLHPLSVPFQLNCETWDEEDSDGCSPPQLALFSYRTLYTGIPVRQGYF